jgi:hypothetical protein
VRMRNALAGLLSCRWSCRKTFCHLFRRWLVQLELVVRVAAITARTSGNRG